MPASPPLLPPSPHPPLPPGGVAIIVVRDGRVLLGLRAPGKHGGGTWALPGGKAEPGESAEEAGRRELLEETGLRAGRLRAAFEIHDTFPDGRPWDTQFLVASEVTGEAALLEPDKCVAWAWFAPDELPSPLFAPLAHAIAAGAALAVSG